MTKVLMIEDDLIVAETTSRWLTLDGFDVVSCDKSINALNLLEKSNFDVVLSDVRMPEISGLELQQKINIIDPLLPVVLMTGHGDVAMAVSAMEQGAYYFVEKPFEPEHLSQILKRAAAKRALTNENKRLQSQLEHISGIESRLIGKTKKMALLRSQILALAGFDASVIIHGDTGTGKELVASCLHEYSQRSEHPFVAINCGAIAENLLESELFGHEKGAFTGANQTRIGKLEYASKGTLFLDEIESMPMAFQVKLLRALQENTIERVGSNKAIAINPRVICATKVDLKTLSDQGDFRLDLYFRLKIAEIFIPNLRDRVEDIPMLFQHFLDEACHKFNIDPQSTSSDDQLVLRAKEWPGNIRELKNLAQQYAIANVSQATPLSSIQQSSIDNLAASFGQMDNNISLTEQVAQYEEQIIRNAIAQSNGSIKDVLILLKISRRNLNLKMQRYNITRGEYVQ